MKEIMEYLGKRVLLRRSWGSVFEATILEISPSGGYVQIMYPDKHKCWESLGNLVIFEELPSRHSQ